MSIKRRSFIGGLVASIFTKIPTQPPRYLSDLATIHLDSRTRVKFFPSIRQQSLTDFKFSGGDITWTLRTVKD